MTTNDISVLIPDGESDFALFVVRCLAQVHDLRVHVLSTKSWAPLRFSRHVRTYRSQPWQNSADRFMDTLSQAITRTSAQVILPIDEPAIQFISAHLPAAAKLAALPPIPERDTFETVTDKWLLAEFLKEHHIPGPATILYTTPQDLERDLCELQFPVLAKPTKGRGGEGIQRFDDPAKLSSFLRDIKPPLQYIVQRFVHGYDVDCSVLCKDGKILAYTIQRGFVAGAQSFSASAGIDFIQDDQVFDVASRLVSATRWSGVAHMDLRYDNQEKQVKLIELNARYWGSLIGSMVVGVNFPYLACLSALNVLFPMPDYRLGRYIASGAAIKQGVKRLLGSSKLSVAFEETALPYVLADPVAEMIKLIGQAVAQKR